MPRTRAPAAETPSPKRARRSGRASDVIAFEQEDDAESDFGTPEVRSAIELVEKSVAGSDVCVVCGEVLSNAYALQVHLKQLHADQYKEECKFCGRVFAKPNHLMLHLKKTHKNGRYQCVITSASGSSSVVADVSVHGNDD